MATLTHLDTHVVAWLFTDRVDLLSPVTRTHVDTDELAISPMVALELTYLFEIGRLNYDAATMIASLHKDIGLEVDATPFADVVARAHACDWTRDPFDRIIAAQALVADATLVTRDATIREHVKQAVW